MGVQTTEKDLLSSTLESMCQVITVPTNIKPSTDFIETVKEDNIGVLVGITGDIYARVVIKGDHLTFSKLAELMFGMALEGEMLHSFVQEITNMIVGNTATNISSKGLNIDITPPTTMVGKFQLCGFERGISFPIEMPSIGELSINFLLQN